MPSASVCGDTEPITWLLPASQPKVCGVADSEPSTKTLRPGGELTTITMLAFTSFGWRIRPVLATKFCTGAVGSGNGSSHPVKTNPGLATTAICICVPASIH